VLQCDVVCMQKLVEIEILSSGAESFNVHELCHTHTELQHTATHCNVSISDLSFRPAEALTGERKELCFTMLQCVYERAGEDWI